MSKRDEYVNQVKKRLDDWNADIKKLEETYERAEEGARHRLKEQIQSLSRHREEAQEQVRRIEDAAEEFWHEIAKGAEEAWKRMGNTFAGLRASYGEKHAAGKSEDKSPAAEKPAAKESSKAKTPAKKSAKKTTAKST